MTPRVTNRLGIRFLADADYITRTYRVFCATLWCIVCLFKVSMRCGLLRYNSEAHKDCQGSQLEILFPHSTQSSCMHQNKFDKTHENAGQATWSVYLNVVVYFSLSLILTLLVAWLAFIVLFPNAVR